MGGGGRGRRGLQKGKGREVWEKGLTRKGRCSLKKMRVVFSFFKSRPAWINTSFLGLTFKYRLSNTYTCLSLILFFFASSLLNLHATVLYKTYKMEEAKCNNYNKHLNYCYAMEVRGRGFYPPPPPLPIVVC